MNPLGLVTLGELEHAGKIRLYRGKVISKKDISANPGPYPIYSSSVKNNGLFGRYGFYMLDEELITWSVDGGGNFFYRQKHKFSVTNVCGYLRVTSDDLNTRYLAYLLQDLHSRLHFDYTLKAHPSVIRGAYRFEVPDISEQVAVASALGDADELISSLERLIAKKQAIKQGMMQQLLTGRTRLPGFDCEWQKSQLGDVLNVCHGRNQKSVEVSFGSYPILATGGTIGWTNTPLYSSPSVLIGRKGTIDRPQYQDQPFWTVDTLFYTEIHSELADPRYLYYLFLTVDWRSMNEASGVPSLNAATIKQVGVELPSLREQIKIRETLDDAEREIDILELRLAKARDIKAGMMQQLLTGRTRLPVEAES